LFDSRQTISSRQSPNRSAERVGVDLVPLFEAHWPQVSREPPPYFVIVVPSSSSRDSSPSHQITKLICDGLLPRVWAVVALRNGTPPDAHISAPGLSGSMSAATPRPVSVPSFGLL